MFSSHSWEQKFSITGGHLFLTLLLGVMCFGQQPPDGPDGPPQRGPGRQDRGGP